MVSLFFCQSVGYRQAKVSTFTLPNTPTKDMKERAVGKRERPPTSAATEKAVTAGTPCRHFRPASASFRCRSNPVGPDS